MARKTTETASETVVVDRLVWVRDVAHEAGTRFSVVDVPAAPKEVTSAQALRWEQEGWLMVDAAKARPASAAAGEGG